MASLSLVAKMSWRFEHFHVMIALSIDFKRALEYATSAVLRVTFGWEDEDLPKSVVLKTPAHKDKREDEEAKYHYLMFKR